MGKGTLCYAQQVGTEVEGEDQCALGNFGGLVVC